MIMATRGFFLSFLENGMKVLKRRIPTGVRTSLGKRLAFAGDTQPPEDWLFNNVVFIFFFSILFAPLAYYLPTEFSQRIDPSLFPIVTVLIFALLLSLLLLLAYLSMYYKIEGRRRRTEKILPDFLSVVSMNIDSGMEPLSALYVSLRPDFDPIAFEMKLNYFIKNGFFDGNKDLNKFAKKSESNATVKLLSSFGSDKHQSGTHTVTKPKTDSEKEVEDAIIFPVNM